jgi:hypothetical protein
MKLSRLPISRCHANCERCGLPTEFRVFESGPGGDFGTYVGLTTQNLYRLNLNKARYSGKMFNEALSPAIEREGKGEMLREIPTALKCKLCGHVFEPKSYRIDGEEIVDAYDL